MSRNDPDVAVVGCGPVGLTLAVLLAQRGHSVTLLERWAHPYPLPRAVHIDHEVARVLQSAGIGAELTRITSAVRRRVRTGVKDARARKGKAAIAESPAPRPASAHRTAPTSRGGWRRSTVFGRSFRLDRQLDEAGLWDYTLHVR